VPVSRHAQVDEPLLTHPMCAPLQQATVTRHRVAATGMTTICTRCSKTPGPPGFLGGLTVRRPGRSWGESRRHGTVACASAVPGAWTLPGVRYLVLGGRHPIQPAQGRSCNLYLPMYQRPLPAMPNFSVNSTSMRVRVTCGDLLGWCVVVFHDDSLYREDKGDGKMNELYISIATEACTSVPISIGGLTALVAVEQAGGPSIRWIDLSPFSVIFNVRRKAQFSLLFFLSILCPRGCCLASLALARQG